MHENVTTAHLVALSSRRPTGARRRIVCTAMDFPSMVYLFRGQQVNGFELRIVPAEADLTIRTDRFLDAIDETTAIVDFAVGGCLKWLCGGPGNAFLYMRPDLVKRTRPAFTGWVSHPNPFAFDIDEDALRDDALHMMNGTPAIPAYYAALAGLDIINAVGVDRIRARSKTLTARLLARIDAGGFSSAASRDPERLAGTVAVSVPDAALVARTLKARDFVVDYRPPVGVRISPHFYNTTDEVDAIMSEIESIVAKKDYDVGESGSLVT